MKNILSSLNESEKNRILGMHKKATRKNYISESVILNFEAQERTENYLKSGGTISSKNKVITSNDTTTGYKFTEIDSNNDVVLMYGQHKLIIDPMSMMWKADPSDLFPGGGGGKAYFNDNGQMWLGN